MKSLLTASAVLLLLALVQGKPRWEPETAIKFFTYTRANAEAIQIFVGDLTTSNIDAAKPTKFIIHGFTDDAIGGWMEEAATALLRVDDYNVINVDWSNIAFVFNVRECGAYVAEMYDFLASQGFNLADIHCTGHSLGAQVCGFSGKGVTGGKIGRITGLDPSESQFEVNTPLDRLNSTDADYVDVIHTSAGTGYVDPIGQVDYFPNGGDEQPGCGLVEIGICSHTIVRQFWIESIESDQFVSKECLSFAEYREGLCDDNPSSSMGLPSVPGTTGTYFLRTNNESPFARG